MKTRKHQYAFAAGEVSPEFYGRGDSAQYQTGVATARNFVIKPQGSARTRPGLEHVSRTATQNAPTHLIPFVFDLDESFVVALGDYNIRLYQNGSPVSYGTPIDVGEADSAESVKLQDLSQPVGAPTYQRSGGLQTRAPHGLSTGDVVVITNDSPTGTLPDPLGSYRYFRVTVVDARRVTLERDTAPSPETPTWAQVNITAYGSGFLRMWKLQALTGSLDGTPTHTSATVGSARAYVFPINATTRANDSRMWLGQVDQFQVGDRVNVSGGPSPQQNADTYYVVSKGRAAIPSPVGGLTSATFVRLATTLNGTAITWSDTTDLQTTVRLRWQAGDLAFVSGSSSSPGFYSINTTHNALTANDFSFGVNGPNGSSSYYQALTKSGELEITSPYAAEDVADVNYDQSGDVLTLVHPKYPEQELKRFGTTYWAINPVSFSPPLAVPSAPTVSRVFSQKFEGFDAVFTGTSSNLAADIEGGRYRGPFNDLAAGDMLQFISAPTGAAPGPYESPTDGGARIRGLATDELVVVSAVKGNPTTNNDRITDIYLRTLTGNGAGRPIYGQRIDNEFAIADLLRNNNTYRVGAVDKDGNETLGPPSDNVVNSLDFPGAQNDLSWPAVAGADKYIVYRQTNGTGLFEKVGEVVDEGAPPTFADDGVPGDASITAPRYDEDVSDSTNYSRATARFEQRRCFAGSDNFPRRLFMSRTGTESDFSFRIPVLDTDRISAEASAREAHVIRHLVPLGDLLMLTQLGEWRLFAVNSDAITPSTVSIRPQSYVGSSTVRPLVANSSVLFCAARGGHVRQMGYEAQRSGFTTGDLSLRAAHLFDDLEIVRSGLQKSPVPIGWFVSSNGKLLGLTYVPEEQISAWHQHDTDGTFESVACVPEGREDRVYVTVKRTVNGQTVRNVERLSTVSTNEVFESSTLDDSLRYDGTQAGTVQVSAGSYQAGGLVTLAASAANAFSVLDVGRRVYFGADRYRADITAFTDDQTVTARLVDALDASDAATAWTWEKAATEIYGLSHLEGETVQVLRTDDPNKLGVVESVTVEDGRVELDGYATLAEVGRAFTCDLNLLPTTMQMPALGYGRDKSINRAWLRVFEAAGLSVGPDADSLTPVADLQNLDVPATQQTRNLVVPNWSDDAQLLIRQSQPYPATIAAVTLEVSVSE